MLPSVFSCCCPWGESRFYTQLKNETHHEHECICISRAPLQQTARACLCTTPNVVLGGNVVCGVLSRWEEEQQAVPRLFLCQAWQWQKEINPSPLLPFHPEWAVGCRRSWDLFYCAWGVFSVKAEVNYCTFLSVFVSSFYKEIFLNHWPWSRLGRDW